MSNRLPASDIGQSNEAFKSEITSEFYEQIVLVDS